MLENNFFSDVKAFVFNLFKKELPLGAVYHNGNHTFRVAVAANEIGLSQNLSEDDLETVLLAAWFHDTGYIEGAENHEERSIVIVDNYMTGRNFHKEKITKVKALIKATKMPQNPTNKLEEIICDADLSHLGRTSFMEESKLLRLEREQLSNEVVSDLDWLERTEQFLSQHQYFTDHAFESWNEQKTLNWLKVINAIKKITIKTSEQKQKKSFKNKELQIKKSREERPDRGIETMFRVALRNHVKLSDIADTKANILISVCAIILSIALSTLFPKLDKSDNYYLIIPTLLFLFITLVTMVITILSTRPKVTSGNFTEEDVANKKVNLLFFGNFHKMSLDNFQKGITEVMKDRDYLYESMTKDLYFLGIVLAKKYKLLRIAYTIFMYGIVLAVLSFVVSFLLMLNQT
jgi:predicted metal-dependent HD superfamily phosphohydrolase